MTARGGGWERMTSCHVFNVQRSTFSSHACSSSTGPTYCTTHPAFLYHTSSTSSEVRYLVAQTIAGSIRFHAVSDGITSS